MRGHGLSGGARGDSPTTERLWLDLSELIANVRKDCPDTPIYLGGHSSGGGLVLNYASWAGREDLGGYVFVSPKFGYKSNADRHPFTDDPFAKARIWTILLNKFTGGVLNAHAIAVMMNYSPEAKAAEPLLVDAYTCSVVNAITPANPERQFREIDRPFHLFVGDSDELMLPENTVRYFSFAGDAARRSSKAEIVTDQNHLGILRVAGDLIGSYFESAR